MLDPSIESNLPKIVQILFDWKSHRWLALNPASHYPKTPGRELAFQSVGVMWDGPIEPPRGLADVAWKIEAISYVVHPGRFFSYLLAHHLGRFFGSDCFPLI